MVMQCRRNIGLFAESNKNRVERTGRHCIRLSPKIQQYSSPPIVRNNLLLLACIGAVGSMTNGNWFNLENFTYTVIIIIQRRKHFLDHSNLPMNVFSSTLIVPYVLFSPQKTKKHWNGISNYCRSRPFPKNLEAARILHRLFNTGVRNRCRMALCIYPWRKGIRCNKSNYPPQPIPQTNVEMQWLVLSSSNYDQRDTICLFRPFLSLVKTSHSLRGASEFQPVLRIPGWYLGWRCTIYIYIVWGIVGQISGHTEYITWRCWYWLPDLLYLCWNEFYGLTVDCYRPETPVTGQSMAYNFRMQNALWKISTPESNRWSLKWTSAVIS